MKKNIILNIFKNNINNNYKIIPFNIKLTDYRSKYEAPVSKEWKNTIYSYYKKKIQNIPINNINIHKIIISYFNMYFLAKFLNIKNMSKKRRILLLRRIYVSDIEIKHSNNKAIISLYILNTERKRMVSRYLNLEIFKKIKIFLNQLIMYLTKEIYISNNIKINLKLWNKYQMFLNNIDRGYIKGFWSVEEYKTKQKKKIFYSLKNLIFNLNKINFDVKKRSFIPLFYSKNNYELNRFIWFYFFELKNINYLQLLYNLKFQYSIDKSYQEIKIKNKIKELRKKFEEWKIYILYLEKFFIRDEYLEIKDNNNQILSTNLLDFWWKKYKKYTYPYKLFVKKLDKTYSYLYKLNNFLVRILKKKIELNIVSLKSIIYNSDIFTKSLSLKLRKKKQFSIFKGINTILAKVMLPDVNILMERKNLKKIKDNLLVDNRYRNNNLSSNKYLFNNFHKKNNVVKQNEIIFKSLLDSIKYKNIGGLKIEIKGRLTKRYRADRALYKLNWIGGLKNIESSFNKLSSTLYRGYNKPNVTYSIFKSKRRIGAFAIKGWVSGK